MRRTLRSGEGFEDVAAYSRAVRTGRRIVTSATAALDAQGHALHPGDAHAQAALAIELAVQSVVELGGAVGDVTRTRLYLAAGTEWREVIRAHREAFVQVNPANTTVFVHSLIPEGALVEVELEAELDDDPEGPTR